MTYDDEIRAVREGRLGRLRDPQGWLSLVGLEWLDDGENRVGSDPDADVVLRGTDAPASAGVIVVRDGSASFLPDPRAGVTHHGRLVTDTLPLDDDVGGSPTVLSIGSLRFHLIRRVDRLGVRIRDVEAEALKRFTGLDFYPIDRSWRIRARLEPPTGRTVRVPDVIGLVVEETTAGTVIFERDGVELRLDALKEDGEPGLWLIFGDATNGNQTYGGGRFLYTAPPEGDHVVVDFNLAYNPPCAFSPYATCPLPWPENRLPIPIEAGEKRYGLD